MQAYLKILFSKKMGVCCLTGFASGLPLFILISLIPAWLRIENIDLKVKREENKETTNIDIHRKLNIFQIGLKKRIYN